MNFRRIGLNLSILGAWLSFALTLSGLMLRGTHAATLPSGFTETKLIGALNLTTLEIAPDGRIFLCEKNGRIRVYKGGKWLDTPMLNIDVDFTEERGLLGIALDPDYGNNPYIYIYYTAKNPAHNRVSRFRVDGDVATGAETVLIDLNPLTQVGWHNGGSIHFGKDGKLYIAAGNNVNQAYSQSLDVLLGKVLRINPDGSIPEDNPFFKTATGNNRAIWALGLRNPFRTAIHPVTGRYFVHDVGDGYAEEINEGKSGTNYGYPKTEGHAGTPPTGLTGTYGDPVSFYTHDDGCAITGGTFYHPASNTFGPEYMDRYFFSDYCGGWIKSIDLANGNAVKSFATGIARPIELKAGPDGSFYYVARGARAAGVTAGSAADNSSTNDGSLYRITGPVATRLAPGSRTDFHPFLGDRKVELPAGSKGVSIYSLTGRKVWEYSDQGSTQSRWIELPREVASGLFRMRLL